MHSARMLLLGAALLSACSDPQPADMAGTWVLSFPSLFVPTNGFQCTSLAPTALEVAQDGNKIVAPYSQGLLICATNVADSTIVPFQQGTVLGSLDGNSLSLSFQGASGHFSGSVSGDHASGHVDYTDPTYSVAVSGDWVAVRRTPTGAADLSFTTTSSTTLPSVSVVMDGNTVLDAPPNGTLHFTGLTGGRHVLVVGTGGSQSCTVTGGPSGAISGTNPNQQFLDVVESDPTLAISYQVTC